MKDYYQILGVTPDTGEDRIRKQYRALAMQYHPDRNPDDPRAEERFKEIAEAYGVLTDPVKRSRYDAARAAGSDWRGDGTQGGFDYSQEDILRDLFRDPRFQALFRSLLGEFQRSGFRASSQFVRHSFFGGKGLFLGGLFLFGTLAGPALLKSAGKRIGTRKSLLEGVGSAIGSLLTTSASGKPAAPVTRERAGNDLTYLMTLTAEELARGKTVQVVSAGPGGQEMLRVRIPPGSRAGTRLRLKGRGSAGREGRGDLYLQLELNRE